MALALNISQFRRQVAPQDSQIGGENFPKRKKSIAEQCQILRMVTIQIAINSTRVMGIRMTISCRYCIAFEVMLLFLVSLFLQREIDEAGFPSAFERPVEIAHCIISFTWHSFVKCSSYLIKINVNLTLTFYLIALYLILNVIISQI